MKKLLTALLLFVFTSLLSAQPSIDWQRCLGGSGWDVGNAVIQTSDGGYLAAVTAKSNDGDVSNGHGEHDYWLVKLNSEGSIVWQKTYGGSTYDAPGSIKELSEGGYIVAGVGSSEDGDVTGHKGQGDCWLLKIDVDGNLLWEKTFGGSSADAAKAVLQTADGGFIFTGYTDSNNGDVTNHHGMHDFWVVKLSNAGAIQWQKTLGGTSDETARAIIQTSDGGYIVAGGTYSVNGDIPFNYGQSDCFVVKLDALGETVWKKIYGGSLYDTFEDIVAADDGGYLLVGTTGSTNGDVYYNQGGWDCWVVKLYYDGELEWQMTYGGAGGDRAFSVQKDSNNEYAVAGFTASNNGDVSGGYSSTDVWIFKLTSSGDFLWQKPMGGDESDYGFSMCLTLDGGYLLCGNTNSNNGDVSGYHGGDSDAWVVKLSAESSPTSTPQVNNLEIYPNPVSSIVTINTASGESFHSVVITDLLGRSISLKPISDGRLLDVSVLDNGLYLLTATTLSGTVFSKKFIKQHK